jgi:hypothetical protein
MEELGLDPVQCEDAIVGGQQQSSAIDPIGEFPTPTRLIPLFQIRCILEVGGSRDGRAIEYELIGVSKSLLYVLYNGV